jgi:hypothetical protein
MQQQKDKKCDLKMNKGIEYTFFQMATKYTKIHHYQYY